MKLTGLQRKRLRSLSHHKRPVVHTGKSGMSNALLHEIDAALAHHELIKIKIAPGDRLARIHLAREIAAATGSVVVQTIGRTVTLYRRGTKPHLSLP